MKVSRVLTCAVALFLLAACAGSQSSVTSTPPAGGAISGASFATSSIARFSRFAAPEAPGGSIVIGADNAVYLNGTHHFLKFNGTFKMIAYPSSGSGESVITGTGVGELTRGPGASGTVWAPLTHSAPGFPYWWTAGRLHVSTGTADQSATLGNQHDSASSLYWGGDNNIWITHFDSTSCTCGSVMIVDSSFNNLGSFGPGSNDPLDALTKGQDGAMYVATDPTIRAGVTSKIYRFDSSTHKVTNSFQLPAGSHVSQITRGSDSALWFTDTGLNKVGRITTAGVVTYHTIPTANAGLAGITLAGDNALWFTEKNANKIGRITTAGAVTEYTIPSPGSQPAGITAVASHTPVLLYFSEANALGELTF